jgi:hypothetical protein
MLSKPTLSLRTDIMLSEFMTDILWAFMDSPVHAKCSTHLTSHQGRFKPTTPARFRKRLKLSQFLPNKRHVLCAPIHKIGSNWCLILPVAALVQFKHGTARAPTVPWLSCPVLRANGMQQPGVRPSQQRPASLPSVRSSQ